MRIALFLTAERAGAVELARRVREQYSDAEIEAFVRDEDRDVLAPHLDGCAIRRDKPAGGKVAFVRGLRRERFDLLIVAWYGGERFQPLRLVALIAGARRVRAVDERGREGHVAWYLPWTWIGHVLRRSSRLDALTVLRGGAACYRLTIGALIAAIGMLGFWLTRPRLSESADRSRN